MTGDTMPESQNGMIPLSIFSAREKPWYLQLPWHLMALAFMAGCVFTVGLFALLDGAMKKGPSRECSVSNLPPVALPIAMDTNTPTSEATQTFAPTPRMIDCSPDVAMRPDIQARFNQKCGYWEERVKVWASHFVAYPMRPSVIYRCSNVSKGTVRGKRFNGEFNCHGIGDRLAGVHTLFHLALAFNKSLGLSWAYINKIFVPSCLYPKGTTWAKSSVRNSPHRVCELFGGQTCRTFFESPKSRCIPRADTDVIIRHPLRACTNISRGKGWMVNAGLFTPDAYSECASIQHYIRQEKITFAHVSGCALRILLQPSLSLKHSLLPFRIHNATLMRTVDQIEKSFSDYFVISIYMRVHLAEKLGHNAKIPADWEPLKVFTCAKQIEADAVKNGITGGRPVKWMFASDSVWLRDKAVERFPDKIMMADFTPQHVSKIDKHSSHIEGLQQAFTEWYLLSLGDEAVINKMSIHGQHQIYEGRLSGFASSFWSYSLRSSYIDAGTCKRMEMGFDGAWKKAYEEDSCPEKPGSV